MAGQKPKPYTITPTRPGSTRGHGYHDLREYAGPVPRQHPVPPLPAPAPGGQTASFRQGIADAIPQSHHALRSAVTAFAVGVVVGDRLSRMRGRR